MRHAERLPCAVFLFLSSCAFDGGVRVGGARLAGGNAAELWRCSPARRLCRSRCAALSPRQPHTLVLHLHLRGGGRDGGSLKDDGTRGWNCVGRVKKKVRRGSPHERTYGGVHTKRKSKFGGERKQGSEEVQGEDGESTKKQVPVGKHLIPNVRVKVICQR